LTQPRAGGPSSNETLSIVAMCVSNPDWATMKNLAGFNRHFRFT
jgi:hypothetical protein